jgi:hypothetical protein
MTKDVSPFLEKKKKLSFLLWLLIPMKFPKDVSLFLDKK